MRIPSSGDILLHRTLQFQVILKKVFEIKDCLILRASGVRIWRAGVVTTNIDTIGTFVLTEYIIVYCEDV